MNTRNWIVIHHTGSNITLGETDGGKKYAKWQFDAVQRFHERKGWKQIGYHWFIEHDGTIRRGRQEWEAGAHTSQRLMNYRSIGICLAGNFDEEHPSGEQIASLKALLTEVQLRNGIGNGRIRAHRLFATYKSCPGMNFTDKFLDEVVFSRPEVRRTGIPSLPDLPV